MLAGLRSILGRTTKRITHSHLVVALAAVMGAAGILNPDKIAIQGGFGWDGIMYGTLAQDFWSGLGRGLSAYHAGRLAPSFVIHHALRALSVSPSPGHVVLAFGVHNALMLVASAWLWTRVARRLGVGPSGLWFGFVAAFVTYFVLKVVSFYPVLTDATAFFVGWAMLAAYLKGSSWLLLLSIVLGRFTWPTALPVGAVLLLFPIARVSTGDTQKQALRISPGLRAGLLASLPALALLATVIYWMSRSVHPFADRLSGGDALADVIWPAWPLSLLCAVAYLVWGLTLLLRQSPFCTRWRTYLAPFSHWSTYLKLAFLVGLVVLGRRLGTKPDAVSTGSALKFVAAFAIVAPMKFLVAHTLYFGPVVLVALLGWRAVGRTIGEFGPAPVLLLALALVLSLDSESRHLVNLVPLVVPFVAKAVDEQRPSTKAVAGFAVWSLLVSKAWLVIGSDTSLYFLTEGPWMTHAQYAVQGALLLLVAAWLARSGIVPGQPWRASAASPYAGQRP